MKDLRILFTTAHGERVVKEYDTIMDFLHDYEQGNLTYGNSIFTEFFENQFHHQKADTMEALYKYCVSILK